MSFHVPSCLRVAIEAHAAEAIREKGDPVEGLHVDEIAKASNINPRKLARVLRLLAAHHIFRETSEDVFANNRTSVGLDTGHSLAHLAAHPTSFYSNTDGVAAFLAHATDDAMKGASCLSEHLQDPNTADSYEVDRTPLNRAVGFEGSFWDWVNRPEEAARLSRFGRAMGGLQLVSPAAPFDVKGGFDFASLPSGATVVDVGGGVGSVSLQLTAAFPDLKIVLEDRPEVISGEAAAKWRADAPSALDSGRAVLLGYDFFAAQPVRGAAVYLLRMIVHDWADPEAAAILKRVREAAGPESRLVLCELVLDPVCEVGETGEVDVPGAARAEGDIAPAPLLPVGGHNLPYAIDMQMLINLGSQERTLRHYHQLGRGAGWERERVHRAQGGFSQLVFKTA